MEGMGPKHQSEGMWVYPTIGAALAMVGLDEIGVYFARLQNTVAQFIAIHPIMDLCLAIERNTGMRLSRRWWEHPALDIMGVGLGQVAAEGGRGSES